MNVRTIAVGLTASALATEGAENGFVTVDYDGTKGWVCADLLGEPAS